MTTRCQYESYTHYINVTKNQAPLAKASAMRVKVRRVSNVVVGETQHVPAGRTNCAARLVTPEGYRVEGLSKPGLIRLLGQLR